MLIYIVYTFLMSLNLLVYSIKVNVDNNDDENPENWVP